MKMAIYQNGKKLSLRSSSVGLIIHKNTYHKPMNLTVSPQQMASVSLNSFMYFKGNFQSESLIPTCFIHRCDKEFMTTNS